MCIVVVVLAFMEEGAAMWPVAVLVIPAGVGLPVWLFATTSYRFTDADLLVRSGPFRWRVPLREITSVRPSRDLLSSPALSLDRLRIDYAKRSFILISPRERDEFLRDLESRIASAKGVKE